MGQGNGDNSWYKYLESVQDTSYSSSVISPKQKGMILEQIFERNLYHSQFEMCLFSYSCLICMRYILEVRVNRCEHNSCMTCIPRNKCFEDCKPWLIHSLSADDQQLQQNIIDEFATMGCKIVRVGPTHKRKEPEPDDDEM